MSRGSSPGPGAGAADGPLAPRPGFGPPGVFALRMSGPLEATGRDVFASFAGQSRPPAGPVVDAGAAAGAADTLRTVRVGGVNCLATDAVAFGAMQALLRDAGAERAAAQPDTPVDDGLLFVTATPGLVDRLVLKCRPAPGECCLFVDASAVADGPRCTAMLGERARRALDSLLREPGASVRHPVVGAWTAGLVRGEAASTAARLAESGTLGALGPALAAPLLGFAFAFHGVAAQAFALARRRVAGAEPTPLLDSVDASLQAQLRRWAADHLTEQAQRRYAGDDGTGDRSEVLDFDTRGRGPGLAVPAALIPLQPILASAWGALPDAAWAFGVLADELRTRHARTEIVRQAQATLRFQEGVLTAVLSMDGIDGALRANVRTALARQDQLRDLVVGGGVVGGTTFALGTVYGVLHDLCDTLVQVIRYTFAGMRWVFHQGKAALASAIGGEGRLPPGEEGPAASDAVVASWFPAVDLDAFLQSELPELCGAVRELCLAVREDFIANAHAWGTMVGEYLWSAMGSGLQTTLDLLCEPWDAAAGCLERIAYVVRQWFHLGAVLGPILVDIVLTFCTAGTGGVVAGALKLGKVTRAGEAVRFFRVGEHGLDAVRGLKLFAHVQRVAPAPLARVASVLARVLGQVWSAIGPLRGQLTTVLETLKSRSPEIDLDAWAATIDRLYDWASSLEVLVGALLMLTGGAEVDADGRLVEAPA